MVYGIEKGMKVECRSFRGKEEEEGEKRGKEGKEGKRGEKEGEKMRTREKRSWNEGQNCHS